jgi:hypothetical protein
MLLTCRGVLAPGYTLLAPLCHLGELASSLQAGSLCEHAPSLAQRLRSTAQVSRLAEGRSVSGI